VKVVVFLEHPIRAFSVQPAQLETLAARHPEHVFRKVTDEAAFLRELPDAGAALVWGFAATSYAHGPRLRFVATPAAGRERLEPDPTGRVRSVHGHFHGRIMAESLLGMMLHFSRRLDLALADQREGRYRRDEYSTTRRLSGQTALIVGYGPLGRECARLLRALGLRVLGVKRDATGDPSPADAVFSPSELFTLLPEADHVVLTLPSDTGTDHLFSDAAFAAMRPSAGLYNLGRGNAIDEAALVRALEAKKLAHAFLDVFEEEPLPPSSPLWKTPNLAFTPHSSAISREYLDLFFEELHPELRALHAG
jgi:phosphoglycerate dehydrogenase-like enzyme